MVNSVTAPSNKWLTDDILHGTRYSVTTQNLERVIYFYTVLHTVSLSHPIVWSVEKLFSGIWLSFCDFQVVTLIFQIEDTRCVVDILVTLQILERN